MDKRTKKHRVGEVYKTNRCGNIIIIDYRSNADVKVIFESDDTILDSVTMAAIIKGEIKNPNAPLICDVACIGQGNFNLKNSKKAYTIWAGMVQRCYRKDFHREDYKDCTISKDWLNFQNFAQWFYKQYIPETMEDWQLDKDILVKGNKIYSKQTCCFVPSEINYLFMRAKNKRGNLPIGVSYNKKANNFVAQVNRKGKSKHIGYFKTIEEAFKAYKEVKEEYIKEIANEYINIISKEVYQTMINYQIEITD